MNWNGLYVLYALLSLKIIVELKCHKLFFIWQGWSAQGWVAANQTNRALSESVPFSTLHQVCWLEYLFRGRSQKIVCLIYGSCYEVVRIKSHAGPVLGSTGPNWKIVGGCFFHRNGFAIDVFCFMKRQQYFSRTYKVVVMLASTWKFTAICCWKPWTIFNRV